MEDKEDHGFTVVDYLVITITALVLGIVLMASCALFLALG